MVIIGIVCSIKGMYTLYFIEGIIHINFNCAHIRVVFVAVQIIAKGMNGPPLIPTPT